MSQTLPYVALRAFEMVVRKGNFSAAADELGVSQSAISQHVKRLETWLGSDLLIRGARQSSPTPEGQVLARTIDESLGRLETICSDIRRKKFRDTGLVVCCPPGFAFAWLFPRLLDFDLKHPEISLSVSTDNLSQDRLPDDADIGIRYGMGEFAGLHVEHLMSEDVFPVCAPDLMPSLRPGTAMPDDLTGFTLLMDEYENKSGPAPDWDFWARETGTKLPTGLRSRRFSQSNLVTQAAIQGLGVAMGRGPLVAAALKSAALIRPFSQSAQSRYSYWIAHRNSAHPSVQAFVTWAHEQVHLQ